MILTCPECATSYFVDDDRIPTAGRSVKCSSCGNRWRALPDGQVAPEPKPVAPPAPIDVVEPDDVALDIGPSLDAGPDDLEFLPTPAMPPRPAKAKGGPRGLVIGVLVLGLLAAGAGTVATLREQVAGMVPGAAPLFAAVGLPVNTLGLAFEGVAWKPTFLAGRPVMAVTGAIRNVTDAPIDAPAVRVSLLDGKKAVLAAYELSVTNARVPPGGLRYFAWNLPDPPAGASNLEIGFNLAPKGRAAPGHAGEGHAQEPSAPEGPGAVEPVEATALPAGSPDALTQHE
jgi:predicted Zn finger-like uncharacterized protein